MAKSHLRVIPPSPENRTVATPRRQAYADIRPREHLTEREVEKLIEAAKDNRRGQRDGDHAAPGLPAWSPRQRANRLAVVRR